jgi:2-dehydro-3-deoxygalactonokinase
LRQSHCASGSLRSRSKARKKRKIIVDVSAAQIHASMWAVALDGGTTNTRARLMLGNRIIATARRSVGVRDSLGADPNHAAAPAANPDSPPLRGHRGGLVHAVREVLEEVIREEALPTWLELLGKDLPHVRPEFIAAAGMVSSEVGLLHVPHVIAPAGLHDLAAGVVTTQLPEVSDLPIYFVPGVRTPAGAGRDGWFHADVMRGEESETRGAYAALTTGGQIASDESPVFLWPGSHTKLVEVDGAGRITRSQTTLAGELLQAVARHTLVASSLPASLPEYVDLDAASAGERAVEQDGLGRAAFLVRIAALSQGLNLAERASFWIGAVVADDVINLVRHSMLTPGRSVWVGGRQPLRGLYAATLARRHSGRVVAIPDWLAEAASAMGALEIASRRRDLDRALRFGKTCSRTTPPGQ